MMLVSKDLKKCLALMTLGATLLTGCSSGPGTGFTRFWPKKNNESAVAQDEALAAKWRARINGSNESVAASEIEEQLSAKETETREKSRLGFLRFPWNKDKKQDAQESDEYQKLEARLAELEAEKRSLIQSRPNEISSRELTRRSSMEDPFLKAEQQERARNAFEADAKSNTATVNQSATPAEGLPKWAQQSTEPKDQFQTPIVAKTNQPVARNEFTPGFDQTLNDLGTEVERESKNQSVASSAAPFPSETATPSVAPTAPEMPAASVAVNPPVEKPTEAPVASGTPMIAATATPEDSNVQPKLDRPIADETAPKHPLASLKTVDEQRSAWATLEVKQLMKHARIQARADQFEDAMKTVLAAEQLANNANLKFAPHEQTPSELIMVLKYHIEQRESAELVAATTPKETKAVGVAKVTIPPQPKTEANLPSWPHGIKVRPASSSEVAESSSNVTTAAKESVEQPNVPEWPAQKVASNAPKGSYIESGPAISKRTRAQLITSGSIYSSENLRWAKLESERATLKDPQAQPQLPVEDLSTEGLPPMPVDEDDPFAAAFGSADAEEEALIEELPEALVAPEIPAEGERMMSAWDDEVFGIPVRRMALLFLAGMILLAAIIHRRRNNPEQQV